MTNIDPDPLMPRYTHRTPPEPLVASDTASWYPQPAGDDLDEALRHVLDQFDNTKHASWVIDKKGDGGTALLFAIDTGAVHVVGGSALAGEIRALLASEAIGGWRLHELPSTATPLRTLRPQLDVRFYNLLTRNGFTTVEEAAAAPDEGLRQLRNVGPKFIAALRAVTGESEERRLAVTSLIAGQEIRDRQAYLDERLQVPTALRYGPFIDALARSSLPPAALDKIAEVLNAEDLPPVDPTVALLLETAGEQPLLDHYLGTHRITTPD
ncbi:hypothetical protein [Actinoallomurus oryzae]